MKMIAVGLFFLSLFLFQCNGDNRNSAPRSNASGQRNANSHTNVNGANTASKMTDDLKSSGRIDDVEFEITARLQKKGTHDNVNFPNDNFVITYTLTNTGKNDLLVFNQGHSNNENRSIVYSEILTDGVIELSQKRFAEPTDKPCPARYVPIMPRAKWLKAGQSISEKVYYEYPVKQNTPFDDCGPVPASPEKVGKIKFCIGYARPEAGKTLIDDKGFSTGSYYDLKQQFICSDIFSL